MAIHKSARACGLFILQGSIVVGLASSALAAPGASRHASRKPQQITRASWYGEQFSGRRTAAGHPFNPLRLTAAHRTLGLGTKVKVTELRSGRSVVVQITDRGPFIPGRGIDLSYAAALKLGMVRRGIAQVRLDLVEPPSAEGQVITACSQPLTPWLPKAILE